MAEVQNAVEILRKITIAEKGARALPTERRQTDGRATANSERELEFTFATDRVRRRCGPLSD